MINPTGVRKKIILLFFKKVKIPKSHKDVRLMKSKKYLQKVNFVFVVFLENRLMFSGAVVYVLLRASSN
jgi:hypothetical protein